MRFLGELALSVSVQVQQVAEMFSQVPKCIDCDVGRKMDRVRRGGNLQDQLAAAIELAQERFAIKEPGVWKFLGWSFIHAGVPLWVTWRHEWSPARPSRSAAPGKDFIPLPGGENSTWGKGVSRLYPNMFTLDIIPYSILYDIYCLML